MEIVDPVKVFLDDPRVRHMKGVDDSFSQLYLHVIHHSKRGQKKEALECIKNFHERAKEQFDLNLSLPLVAVE
ncbi:MAG: hypothetical protein AAB552_04150 [Patescibacteria group bacterium]